MKKAIEVPSADDKVRKDLVQASEVQEPRKATKAIKALILLCYLIQCV